MTSELASKEVVEFAMAVAEELGRYPDWGTAYLRYESAGSQTRSSGSLQQPQGVSLISATQQPRLLELVAHHGHILQRKVSRPDAPLFVCLLILQSDMSYRILFEFHDSEKWKITKLDGASGIPRGLEKG